MGIDQLWTCSAAELECDCEPHSVVSIVILLLTSTIPEVSGAGLTQMKPPRCRA